MRKLTYVLATLFTSLSLVMIGVVNYADAAAQTAQVNIQNFAFSPSSISIQQGTTVTWTNRDSTAHTVTGNTSGGPASGHIQPAQSYSFTFKSTGTFPYHCSIHPEMTGSVNVTATPVSQNKTTPTMPSTPSKSTGDNMGPMPMQTKPSNPESTQYQNPATQLPDTGPGQIIKLLLLSTAAGTIIYYLIIHL